MGEHRGQRRLVLQAWHLDTTYLIQTQGCPLTAR